MRTLVSLKQSPPGNFRSRSHKYYWTHIEKCRENGRNRARANAEQMRQYKRKRRLQNPERARAMDKKYRSANPEKAREATRNWRKRSVDKIRAYSKLYCACNRKHILERTRIKRATNVSFRVAGQLRIRVRAALLGKTKSASTLKLLGCDIEFLKRHLESRFQLGMSWDNQGRYGWHIDHIRPCAAFDLSDPVQQQECFHFTNLQPLWALDNHRKSSKIL